jgi:hypothetical protein
VGSKVGFVKLVVANGDRIVSHTLKTERHVTLCYVLKYHFVVDENEA